jgi:hypothetical protein
MVNTILKNRPNSDISSRITSILKKSLSFEMSYFPFIAIALCMNTLIPALVCGQEVMNYYDTKVAV